jgi:hypothetical protein
MGVTRATMLPLNMPIVRNPEVGACYQRPHRVEMRVEMCALKGTGGNIQDDKQQRRAIAVRLIL